MRVLATTLGLALAILITSPPGHAQAPLPVPTGGEVPLPAPDADELYYYITTANPYQKWEFFPGNASDPLDFPVQATEEPHGDWVSVYVNNPANQSLFDPLVPFSLRYGSIIVKENYPESAEPPPADRSTLSSLTVMYKVRGYRSIPTENEWFWAMFTKSGRVVQLSDQQPFIALDQFKSFKGEVQAGKPWFCLSCHSFAQEGNPNAVGDYVWKIEPFRRRN